MKFLITGSCGFIGFHVSQKILEKNNKVVGIDNLNTYYDIKLKKNRLKLLKKNKNFQFNKIDLIDINNLKKIFKINKFDVVINLAAQAGVRYSILNPNIYFESNVIGFYNILNLSKEYKVKHFLYASTSSVYGMSKKFPLNENMNTDKPLSFYAATKKTNEVMAYSYSKIYKLRTTGLRFFTVYGPLGRPDMSLFKFVKNIILNKPIELYNRGKHYRDFTYIDDVANSICGIIYNKFRKKQDVPYEIYNVGNGRTISLSKFVKLIQNSLVKKAKLKKLPLQIGDVKKTHADINKLSKIVNIKKTDAKTGVENFIKWYREYYKS